LIENQFGLLEGGRAAHFEWRRLVVENAVLGVQVHDARLVATMRVHGIRHILTFNGRDFARYDSIEAISPSVLAKTR
jgi:predicted nucleic acid-binding protein